MQVVACITFDGGIVNLKAGILTSTVRMEINDSLRGWYH